MAHRLPNSAFAALWFIVIGMATVLAVGVWWRLRDRVYLWCAGYVGGIGLMSLVGHGWGGVLHERWGDGFIYLNNLLHVPYALGYLGFVGAYFQVRERAPGWARFHRGLLAAYGVVLFWLGFNALTATAGSEWGILGCNGTNLIASIVLAVAAARDHRPGAREFLYASLPLAASGLVLITQFLHGTAHEGGPALLAFRAGFILHVLIFMLALSVRHRGLRLRFG